MTSGRKQGVEEQTVLVGSDHAGLPLKLDLLEQLPAWGWEAKDLGVLPPAGEAQTVGSVDYPDYAFDVARGVAAGEARLGLLLCGAGIGMSIAANKVRGIRAALCHDPYSAQMARAHNNANVLCLGARVTGAGLARAILRVFLETPFEGGRHERRLEKISHAEAEPTGTGHL